MRRIKWKVEVGDEVDVEVVVIEGLCLGSLWVVGGEAAHRFSSVHPSTCT